MERIQQIDSLGRVVAERTKHEWREEFFLHKASLIIPRTHDGKYLPAMRSPTKKPFPGVWVCGVGGTCASGESFLETARREMQEEIGVSARLEGVNTVLHDDEHMRALFRVYTTTEVLDPKSFTLDKTEIAYVHAFSVEELQELVSERPEECAPTAVTAIQAFLLGLLE